MKKQLSKTQQENFQTLQELAKKKGIKLTLSPNGKNLIYKNEKTKETVSRDVIILGK